METTEKNNENAYLSLYNKFLKTKELDVQFFSLYYKEQKNILLKNEQDFIKIFSLWINQGGQDLLNSIFNFFNVKYEITVIYNKEKVPIIAFKNEKL